MPSKAKINVNREYAKWCKEIAKTCDEDELIAHFRRHVDQHFINHKDEGRVGRLVWLVAVYGFVNIFKEKFEEKYKVRTGDMLFENCIHFKEHKHGPAPSFDVDRFFREYKSEVRDYYYRPWRRKIWQKGMRLPARVKVAK